MFSTKDTFLVADCHLDGSRPGLSQLFLQFLNAIEGAGELWILGDFVEFWLGDDAGNPELNPVFDALAACQAAGTNVHLMHGNRDFLIGEAFANHLGIKLHRDDEVLITLGGDKVLLMHGDTLCTDDKDYQQFRKQIRSSAAQVQFLSLGIQERLKTANALREQSQIASAGKEQIIMDVNEASVVDAFTRHGVTTCVHGHTHRPNVHKHAANESSCKRIVLGDWHDSHAMVAHSSGNNLQLINFPF